jgi:hypothetical protein
MSSSAFAYNGHQTRWMTTEEKALYAQRLSSGRSPRHLFKEWLSSVDKFDTLLRELASPGYFNTSHRKRDFRVVTCNDCQGFGIGDDNVRHRCVGKSSTATQSTLKDIDPKASGLQYITLVFPHDLVHHPLHGFSSWPECQNATGIADDDAATLGNELLDAYLDTLELRRQPTRTILQNNWPTVSPFIPTLDGFQLGTIICKKQGSDPVHDLAMAVDVYLVENSKRVNSASLKAPAESLWSDEGTYGSAITTIVAHLAKSTKKMMQIECTSNPQYGYTATRPFSDVRQHDCPTLYDPLLAESGLRYAILVTKVHAADICIALEPIRRSLIRKV